MSISKIGFLLSPIEMILHKKTYILKTTGGGSKEQLVFGIRFAFQNTEKYQAYTISNAGPIKRGTFFIFPLNSVIEEGTVLELGGVDGFPEINLLDQNQIKFVWLFQILVYLISDYDKILEN